MKKQIFCAHSAYDSDETNPRTLTRERREEMEELWYEQIRQHEEQNGGAAIEEGQVKGYVFSFHKWQFVLSDGTEAVCSLGRLKDDQ